MKKNSRMTRAVAVLAAVPPPNTGQRIVTKAVQSVLEACCDSKTFNPVEDTSFVRVRSYTRRITAWIRAAIRAKDWLHGKTDTVMYFVPSGAVVGSVRDFVMLQIVRQKASRVVAHVHVRSLIDQMQRPIAGLVSRKVLSKCDCVIVLADRFATALAENGITERRIRVIPNTVCGVDPPNSDQVISAEIRRKEKPTFEVIFIGNFLKEKGYGVAAKACIQMAEQGVPIRLTLIGQWPNASSFSTFNDWCARNDPHGVVNLVGSIENRSTLQSRLIESDCLVLPSTYRHEAQPLVVVEALACGVPVVSNNVGAIEEMVEDGVSGVVLDGVDLEAVSAGLNMVRSEKLAGSMCREARARFEREFSPEMFRQRIEDAALNDGT